MFRKIIFSIISCFILSSLHAQEEQLYLVRHIDFKHDMIEKGMKIGMKYFNGGNKAAGKDVKVFRFRSGPWDALIMEPISGEDPISHVLEFKGPHSKAVWEAMLEIAGSHEELVKAIREYSNAVAKEEISFCRAVVD